MSFKGVAPLCSFLKWCKKQKLLEHKENQQFSGLKKKIDLSPIKIVRLCFFLEGEQRPWILNGSLKHFFQGFNFCFTAEKLRLIHHAKKKGKANPENPTFSATISWHFFVLLQGRREPFLQSICLLATCYDATQGRKFVRGQHIIICLQPRQALTKANFLLHLLV